MRGDPKRWGVHAFKRQQDAISLLDPKVWGDRIVIGSVEMWGEIVEHEAGFRAEYAAVASLERFLKRPRRSRFDFSLPCLKRLRVAYGLPPKPHMTHHAEIRHSAADIRAPTS